MSYVPLSALPPCSCGGKQIIKRALGWWHIECSECGKYPTEYIPGSTSVRVYGWNTRNDAITAWKEMTS